MKKDRQQREYRVPSDLSEVQRASADILRFLKAAPLTESSLFDVRLCLEEALINAIKYGNRLCREKPVEVGVEHDSEEVRIRVKDQGTGFDVGRLADCTQADNLLKTQGRGVYLIRKLMDRAEYNACGNELLMVKRLPKRPGVRSAGLQSGGA